MSTFTRRLPRPKHQSNYQRYRPLVREDFRKCCAHCCLYEDYAAGAMAEDGFVIDHFEPKGPEDHPDHYRLKTDYYNCYYCCLACNKYKWLRWPTLQEQSEGQGFVDLCKDSFEAHYRLLETGEIVPYKGSQKAKYTIDNLRLNRRKLVEKRRELLMSGYLLDQPPLTIPHFDRVMEIYHVVTGDN